jgi:protein TonB
MSAVMQGEPGRYAGHNHVLNYAVALSLLLHAVLLFGLPDSRESQRIRVEPAPIVARLMERQPAPAVVATSPPIPPAAAQRPEPRQIPTRVPVPNPEALNIAPQAAPQPAPMAPAAPVASESAGEPAAGPVAKTEAQTAASALAAEAPDAGTLAQYRLQLISAAKRYKRYPRVAMDNNWEGDVVVRMVIDADGMIASASVKTGSGHEVLDSQALEMFKRAKPLVPIPSALRGKEFIIELRAIYNLRDQDSG